MKKETKNLHTHLIKGFSLKQCYRTVEKVEQKNI